MQLVVGRVGRAHGLRGEVAVQVRTDDPALRFAPGAVLPTEPASAGPLTVVATRWHSGRLLVTFAQASDRTGAEALRGTVLLVEVAEDDVTEDPDEFYDHQLLGLRAVTPGGLLVGRVEDVLHLPGQDVLVVARAAGGEGLIPFICEFVPQVDVPGGQLVVTPPPGLLELGEQPLESGSGAVLDQSAEPSGPSEPSQPSERTEEGVDAPVDAR